MIQYQRITEPRKGHANFVNPCSMTFCFPLKFYEIKSNTSEYQMRRAFIIIIKEAGRKSVQELPDFASYSTMGGNQWD